ncbi:MAG: Fe-S cluster assembly protein SufD [Candidatus Malihini olakiniferum]
MAGLPTNSNTLAEKQAKTLQQWQKLFNASSAADAPSAQHHWQEVQRLGLPGRKHEHWKYTLLDGLLAQQFSVPDTITIDEDTLAEHAMALDGWRLVFVNGIFNTTLSDVQWGPYQIAMNAPNAPTTDLVAVQPELFLHLTESLSVQHTAIRLSPECQAEKPLYILHISRGQSASLDMAHQRHHLYVGAGASAEIIEHYISLDDKAHFTGARLTVHAAANSQVKHLKLAFEAAASYHFAHNDIILERDARMRSHSFLLGAGSTRHHTSAQINGEGVNLSINSLILPIGSEVCDTRTYLEHNQGHGKSRQLHKAIVSDNARAVFNGMIKVVSGALKTDGQMINNNLLLGRLAEVDTKPQLEVYADDVKCSHGATVGHIDEEQLFYLHSRGISQQAAQQIIIYAFAAKLMEALDNDMLQETVLQRIALRLPNKAGVA